MIQPPKSQDFNVMAAVMPAGFEQSKLLYRYSRDEQSNLHLHLACDNKGPLLILIQAQGHKFGAYSEKGLESIGGWRKSNKSYLFGILNGNVPVVCPIMQG